MLGYIWGIVFQNSNDLVIEQNSQHLLYNKLAWVYDRIYPRIFPYEEIFSLIDPHLINNRVRKILEVACGTGRLMSIMEDAWYEVTGLDLSNEMLSIARKRCYGKLIQKDMRFMEFDETYDAVLCLGSSFTYMQTEDDVEQALCSFRHALEPGGILIFDNMDAAKINHNRLGSWLETTYNFNDVIVTRRSFNSDYNEFNNTWNVTWQYIIDRSGTTEGITDQAKLRAFHKDYLFSKLKKCGFILPEMIDEKRLLIKAYKRK